MQATGELESSSQDHEAVGRKQATIIGCIDDINECGVFGWAYGEATPDSGLALAVHIDGDWITDIVCRALREDVARAGHPASEVGFHVWIPASFCDGEPHTLVFRDQDGNGLLLPRARHPATVQHSFTISVHFDPVFYAAHYFKSIPTNGLKEVKHWKAEGARSNNFPNPAALIAALAAEGQVLPAEFHPQHYRLLNRDLGNSMMSDWQLQLHYLQVGSAEGRPFKIEFKDLAAGIFQEAELAKPRAGQTSAQNRAYASIVDMFTQNDCTSTAFMRHFRVEDYIAHHPSANFTTRLQCIRHFLEVGRHALSPISFECLFDPAFYIDIARLDPATAGPDAYLHWLNEGIDGGLPPSPVVALREMGLKQTQMFPKGFVPEIFAALNPDLEDVPRQNRWEVLRSLIDKHLAEGRPGCPLDATTCDIYLVVADRLAIANSLQSSRKIYERVLAAFPTNARALRHYGDCLLKLGEYHQAASLYRATIELGQDNVWTHINQATCLSRSRRWSDAAAVMGNISALRPGDWNLRRLYNNTAREGFDAIAAEATWLAQRGFYDEAKIKMDEACSILTRRLIDRPADTPPSPRAVSKLAIIADLGLPQCVLYRVTQKSEQLTAAGIEHRIFDFTSDITLYLNACGDFDALLLYRVPVTVMLVQAVDTARRAGQAVFYEIDDLMFDQDNFPASFASYGGQISHDLYASLVVGTVCLRHALSICDFAIASTTALAAAMTPFPLRKKAFVHRNGLGLAHQRSLDEAAAGGDAGIRLFYGSGTKAHNEDFEHELAPCLAKLFARHGAAIRLVVMGYLTLPDSLKPYAAWITQIEPIWDIDIYWSVLKTMSINIAVLSPGKVADCKSEIKWLEAAMFAIPSVVTATATYEEVIRDGETGILIRHATEWFAALDSLVCSAGKRHAIGTAARTAALANYAQPTLSNNIRSILNNASDGKANAAAAKRQRILIVHVFFPPQSFGGATRVVADNITDILEEYGEEFEIEVFTTVEGRSLPYLVTTYQWARVRVTGISTPVDPEINKKAVDENMGRAFASVIDRFSPDLIHFHCIQRLTTSLCTVAIEARTPYVITLHDAWWLSDQQFIIDEFGQPCFYKFGDAMGELKAGSDMSLKRMLAKQKALYAARRLFSVSEPFAAIYRDHGFHNVITIENGLPPFARPARSSSPDGRVRIAHIGGTSFHKGYHLLVAVLTTNSFPNLHHLQIDHSLEAGSERTDKWGATDVVVRGSVPQQDIGALYAEIDVLLAPSIWPESYGLVAREALAAGCWVVASDRGAIGQDVEEATGFVIDVGSHDPLRDVLQLINDNAIKYTKPPVSASPLRTARQQAIELADQYRHCSARPAGGKDVPQAKKKHPDEIRLPKSNKLKATTLAERL